MGISLAMTLIIEILIALLWKIRDPLSLLLVAAVNLLTNPAVVAIYYLMAYLSGKWAGSKVLSLTTVKLLLEGGVVCVEAICCRWADKSMAHPWLFSLTANAGSYWIGAGIQKWF